jgi:hypothetical protein
MMTLEQERRYELCRELYFARKQMAAADPADINLRADIRHRLQRLEAALGYVDEKAFADFALNLEAQEAERRRVVRERTYEKTGLIYGGGE